MRPTSSLKSMRASNTCVMLGDLGFSATPLSYHALERHIDTASLALSQLLLTNTCVMLGDWGSPRTPLILSYHALERHIDTASLPPVSCC